VVMSWWIKRRTHGQMKCWPAVLLSIINAIVL